MGLDHAEEANLVNVLSSMARVRIWSSLLNIRMKFALGFVQGTSRLMTLPGGLAAEGNFLLQVPRLNHGKMRIK